MKKLGVLIVGVGGAVASTVIAGVHLMRRGLAPRIGMLTERGSDAAAQPDRRCARLRAARRSRLRRVGHQHGERLRRRAPPQRAAGRAARAGARRALAHHPVAGRLQQGLRGQPRAARTSSRASGHRAEIDAIVRQHRGVPRRARRRSLRHGQPRLDRELARGQRRPHQPRQARGRARRRRPGHLAVDALLLRGQQGARPLLQLHAHHLQPRARAARDGARQPLLRLRRQDRADAA